MITRWQRIQSWWYWNVSTKYDAVDLFVFTYFPFLVIMSICGMIQSYNDKQKLAAYVSIYNSKKARKLLFKIISLQCGFILNKKSNKSFSENDLIIISSTNIIMDGSLDINNSCNPTILISAYLILL